MNATAIMRTSCAQHLGLRAGVVVFAGIWLAPSGAPFLAAWALLAS